MHIQQLLQTLNLLAIKMADMKLNIAPVQTQRPECPSFARTLAFCVLALRQIAGPKAVCSSKSVQELEFHW